MSILDVVIILALLFGAVIGFKRGIITSAVMFFGTIIVIYLSYLLKNPISELLYTYLPFFKFGGLWQNVSVINIIVYEAIAFLVTFSLLMIILKVVVVATKIIEKIFKATIILGIPSKILGAIFGVLEAYLILFVILFSINQFNWFSELTSKSKADEIIINKTPILKETVADALDSFTEIYDLQDKYRDQNKNSDAYNKEALEIMLKNGVISPNSVRKLVKKDKIKIDNIEEILIKYEGEK